MVDPSGAPFPEQALPGEQSSGSDVGSPAPETGSSGAPARSSPYVLNALIVLFGLVAACGTQVVIAPIAFFIALAIGSEAQINSGTLGTLLVLGSNLAIQVVAVALVAVAAFIAKRLWLLQGWIIGALIGFLLYAACYGMFTGDFS